METFTKKQLATLVACGAAMDCTNMSHNECRDLLSEVGDLATIGVRKGQNGLCGKLLVDQKGRLYIVNGDGVAVFTL